MRFRRALFGLLFSMSLPAAALAQQVLLQGGAWTQGHMPIYAGQSSSQPIVQDPGTAGGGGAGLGLSELLIVSRTGNGVATAPYADSGNGPSKTHACMYDAPTTNSTGYHYLCFDPNAQGGGLLAYGAGGLAGALPFTFLINGVSIVLPTSAGSTIATINTPLVDGDAIIASGTGGKLTDGGVKLWSTAGTDGQLLVGQTGLVPVFRTLAGDVSSINSSGVVTIDKVNGVPFPTSFTANAPILGNGVNTVQSSTISGNTTTFATALSSLGSAASGDCLIADGSGNITTVAPCPKLAAANTWTALNSFSNVAITGGTITGMPSPTASSDVATKAYVDGAVFAAFHILSPANEATAAVLSNTPTYNNGTLGVGATLTAGSNGALTVDGVLVTNGDRVLVKNQAAALQNGVYTVTDAGSAGTPYVLTRATDADTAAEISNAYVFVLAGTTNTSSAWVSNVITTMGTDAINFTQFSAQTGVVSLGGLTGVIGLGSGLGTSGSNITFPTAQPDAHTWASVQTFSSSPVAPTPGTNANDTTVPTEAWVNTYFATLGSPTFTGNPKVNGTLNVVTGYKFNGGAASSYVLRGNGTNFVSALLAASDLSNGVTGSGTVVLSTSPTIAYLNLSSIPNNIEAGFLCWDNLSGQVGFVSGSACGPSDARMKTNWGTAPGLKAIMSLHPGSFDWIDVNQAKDGRQIGLKAQDVRKVIPEIVFVSKGKRTIHLKDGKTRTIENVETLDYSKLTIPLIRAVQEQQREIERLRSEIRRRH